MSHRRAERLVYLAREQLFWTDRLRMAEQDAAGARLKLAEVAQQLALLKAESAGRRSGWNE